MRAANRVDLFSANSANVRARIRRFYGREAEILYPPINTDLFRCDHPFANRKDFFLVVGRLVRYKRFDSVIRVCNEMSRRLLICGDGPDRARLEMIAGPTVQFAGHVTDADLVGLYSRARAVIVPGEEDWGMIGLEANACGCPALAAAWGVNKESVRDGVTGILYDAEQVGGLADGIERLQTTSFDPSVLIEHAGNYSEYRFRHRIDEIVGPLLTRMRAAR
jgi:glycosyltransferase involved in cell wall biosynthesis